MTNEREEVIPVVKEELEVGKRTTERRYRVRSYIVEHPVEKTVTVRDERVEIATACGAIIPRAKTPGRRRPAMIASG